MADVLITGLPRSGTTLAVSLLNHQPNTVALAEPFQLATNQQRDDAVEQVIALMRAYRDRALSGSPLPTKHVGGKITENFAEAPNDDAQLRQVMAQHGELLFNKELSEDFTLVVKHPGEFTALSDLLVDKFPLFAIVRDPLAVLAAWQTVDMPIQRGRMPILEYFAPDDLKMRLQGIEEPAERQVELLQFQLRTYLSLGRERIIRYEDLVTDPQKALAPICEVTTKLPARSAYDAIERYPGIDFSALASRLQPIFPLIEEFYPDFRRKWRGVLPASTTVARGPAAHAKQPSAAPGPYAPDAARVFVMGAYIPAGGTHMAYEIGRVAHKSLGLSCHAVICDQESPQQSVFDYPEIFDSVQRGDLPGIVRPQDLLICNPSFSDGSVGLIHNCRKLMYVQGFNTFTTLDRWFDSHIAVSGFVQDYLANVYGLEAPIIRPFVTIDNIPQKSWWSREKDSVWFYLKGNQTTQMAILERFRQELRNLDPAAEAAIDWDGSILWAGSQKQHTLLTKLAERRHFVTLSACEGFGLVPLEAMAMGTTVLGFDGFGSRDYMRSGANCLVQVYPNLKGVAVDLLNCLHHEERAATIAARGPATAARYSRAQFEVSWQLQIQSIVNS